VGETKNLYEQHPEIVSAIEADAEEFRRTLGDKRLGRVGAEIREAGVCRHPKPLTRYDETHPYMIAYYDLADMPTMVG
jgi:hypothetical protein